MVPLTIIGDQYQPGGINIQTTSNLKFFAAMLIHETYSGRVVVVFGNGHYTCRIIHHKVSALGPDDGRAFNSNHLIATDLLCRIK